jgi:hypothetical protein
VKIHNREEEIRGRLEENGGEGEEEESVKDHAVLSQAPAER